VPSGFMLQNSRASPTFGFTDRPFPGYLDTELKLGLALGNTVSPPSSTSDLHKDQKQRTVKLVYNSIIKHNIKPIYGKRIRVYRYIRSVATREPPFLVMTPLGL